MQFPLLTAPLSWQGPMHFQIAIAISILSLSTTNLYIPEWLGMYVCKGFIIIWFALAQGFEMDQTLQRLCVH